MYSKELEELIESVIADGVITEKERNVLYKRAMKEGVDPDELDVIIDGRLAKKLQQNNPSPSSSTSSLTPPEFKNNKYGEVRKCPYCGEIVQAGEVKCDACGNAFVGIDAINSRIKLSLILEEIEKRDYSPKSMIGMVFGNILADSDRDKARARAIIDFPIPNSKEDLLEFILYLQPHSRRSSYDGERETLKAYKQKYEECVNKAKFHFPNDPKVQEILPEKRKGLFGGLFGKK